MTSVRTIRGGLLFAVILAFVGGYISSAPDVADADIKDTYPQYGLPSMGFKQGYDGEIRFQASASECNHSNLALAFEQIRSTTANTSELIDRFPRGIIHNVSCDLEIEPLPGGDYDACNASVTLQDPYCGFINGAAFNNTNSGWDVYLWTDPNEESFRQLNNEGTAETNVKIGARVRHHRASAAYCVALQASSLNCGRRSVVQWNITKRPLGDPTFAGVMVHELGHTHGLDDLERGESLVSKMNYDYEYVSHVGYPAYDRADIMSVYRQLPDRCSVTLANFDKHKGAVVELGEGIHKGSALNPLNNAAGSMRVHGGFNCKLKVCDWWNGKWDLGAGCKWFDGSSNAPVIDLSGVTGRQGLNFNNRISYVRVLDIGDIEI